MNDLVPVEQAWVCKRETRDQIGYVKRIGGSEEEPFIEVDFGPAGQARLYRGEWGCGLRPGFVVQDIPLSGVRETLGLGTVIETRELAAREQVLVQLHQTGATCWLPFERLRRVKDGELRYRRGEASAPDAAERLAVKIMAHALRSWNEATGALDRLDVDPLPHQIGLVHRILNSGQTNWLIADDVGLGKTIEVGLLLAGLQRRQNIRRVLIVVPAGLTQQWKEEMLLKFDRRFLIYGVDFRVSDPGEWGLYEHVIVSLDLAKPRGSDDDGSDTDTAFGMFASAGAWDIIIFDEAHRLSRDERGRSTLRFRLAQQLRKSTDALVLLSGTPHQGDSGKFNNLLSLVRPDLQSAISLIDENPDVVGQIVLRNRKIDAVDLEGNFIFKGVLVRRVPIATDDAFIALLSNLAEYLNRGYTAGDAIGGSRGRAVGFVMTIYRKLASSSVAALWIALRRRLERISASNSSEEVPVDAEDDDETDNDSLAEHESIAITQPFFDNERQMLELLINQGAACMRTDSKGEALRQIARDVVQMEGKKLLIFTEYRATQSYILLKLEQLLGRRPVVIHGGLTVDEKRAAVAAFEADADVLVSTEAGGEGLNLHRKCHIMVNFDLPWNPAHITQQIGRLYRYGQTERVVVINFHARDTIDNEIVSTVLDRVDTIVREMAGVGPEFDERYAAEVMGELLERIDISELLDEARFGRIERTDERVAAALDEARRAKSIQDEVLSHVVGYDISKWQELGPLTTLHLAAFVKRAAPLIGIEVETRVEPEHFTIRLPEILRSNFPEFGGRTVVAVTTKRGLNRNRDIVLLDFSTSFIRFLARSVIGEEFGGSYAAFVSDTIDTDLFAVFLARFQNDQGHPQGERLILTDSASTHSGGSNQTTLIQNLFASKLETAQPQAADPRGKKSNFDALKDRAEVIMAGEMNRFLHPNDLVTVAIAEHGSL